MPPLHSKGTRELLKQRRKTNLPRSLHRGLHINEEDTTASTYKSSGKASTADYRDLLVHHQRINDSLQDLYARTAALHSDNATMEERIEDSWRQFERIGGKRPTNVRVKQEGSSLCVNSTAIPYAQRLASVSAEKKGLRERAGVERDTRGEVVDYSEGSALHALKDKRVRAFQKRQLKRAHMLRRMGDPTPLNQSGKYDLASGTLQVFNKTIRKVKREVAQDERIGAVKTRRQGQRSQWDVSEYDLNKVLERSGKRGRSEGHEEAAEWNFSQNRRKRIRR